MFVLRVETNGKSEILSISAQLPTLLKQDVKVHLVDDKAYVRTVLKYSALNCESPN